MDREQSCPHCYHSNSSEEVGNFSLQGHSSILPMYAYLLSREMSERANRVRREVPTGCG